MDKLNAVVTARTAHGSYVIRIGDSILGEALASGGTAPGGVPAAVVNRTVDRLHGEYVRASLPGTTEPAYLVMEDGEENKSYERAGAFLGEFILRGMDRSSMVTAVGGGVTGDFAGFCAGVFMRGIPVVQVPTTLLAMVDSSIGGKVAVNLSRGKNMVGVFHQPDMVVCDTSFLRTLPFDETKNGLTEALKHGLIGDGGTLELMESCDAESICRPENLARLVALSAAFKAGIVARDERESGIRAILNFGHTAGHAAESLTEYRGIPHGRAVAFGMAVAADMSRRLGLLGDAETDRVFSLIVRYGLMDGMPPLDPAEIIGHMRYDKKNAGGRTRFVLLDGTGNPVIGREVGSDIVRASIETAFSLQKEGTC